MYVTPLEAMRTTPRSEVTTLETSHWQPSYRPRDLSHVDVLASTGVRLEVTEPSSSVKISLSKRALPLIRAEHLGSGDRMASALSANLGTQEQHCYYLYLRLLLLKSLPRKLLSYYSESCKTGP